MTASSAPTPARRAARNPLARALLPIAFGVAAALGLQTLALGLGNTLHANGRWESTKVGLDHGILGAVSFVTTRTALHLNRLDLGAWHGFHELLLREPLTPERIALRFRLRKGGWLAVYAAHDGRRFEAVRLSRDEGFPSACLAGSAAGAFDAKTPLAEPGLDRSWHSLEIRREGDARAVRVDGTEIGRCAAEIGTPARVGVRASAAKHVEVDDVDIDSTAPRAHVREDFANHRHEAGLLAGALGLVAAIDLAVAALGARGRRARGESLATALLATNLVLGACVGLALAADAAYFGRIHPRHPDFGGYPNRIEYEGQIVPRLRREVPPGPAPAGVRRIVVLGTSQTWGSGAAHPEDVWVRRLEAALNAAAAPGERFELIDAGLPGEISRKLREHWAKDWIGWQPELVLIDLGNNDRDAEVLEREVEKIVAMNEARGIRTALVAEPNCIESRNASSLAVLTANHAALRAVAERHQLPLVEAHAALTAQRDSGFLWWDRVHLTSYGQELLARLLFEQRAHWLGLAAREEKR